MRKNDLRRIEARKRTARSIAESEYALQFGRRPNPRDPQDQAWIERMIGKVRRACRVRH